MLPIVNTNSVLDKTEDKKHRHNYIVSILLIIIICLFGEIIYLMYERSELQKTNTNIINDINDMSKIMENEKAMHLRLIGEYSRLKTEIFEHKYDKYKKGIHQSTI
jgi:hypothetical protein